MIEIKGRQYPNRDEHRAAIVNNRHPSWLTSDVKTSKESDFFHVVHPMHNTNDFRAYFLPAGAIALYGTNVSMLFRADDSDATRWVKHNAGSLDALLACAVRPEPEFLPAEAMTTLTALPESTARLIRELWFRGGVIESGDAFQDIFLECTHDTAPASCYDWNAEALTAAAALQWLVEDGRIR